VKNHPILPARSILGGLQLPGDKSIAHRYAILAALAQGPSEIDNFSSAADCSSTLACLERLGVRCERASGKVIIHGQGPAALRASWRKLDAGNSGTTMRLLAGVLAGQPFRSTLTGDASLRHRPMRRVIEPLTLMGAQISARDGDLAPLRIRGTTLRPVDYALPVASAQVKSAVLLAGLFADGATSVTEPVRTRDHTELALAAFGADVQRQHRTIRVTGRPRLAGCALAVPGDLSSAMFFVAAALLLPESSLMIRGVGLNPTRGAVLDFLAGMGARLQPAQLTERHGELIGELVVRSSTLTGGVIAGEMTAKMIDELPVMAALAPFTTQGIEIRDAAELRVKESDRIAAIAENLRRMGADVAEQPDGLRIPGGQRARLHGAEFDPRGDHRIAMAFAVAALALPGASAIRDAECAAVSFPAFFPLLESLVQR
jgi:3-phosphoshikimate 1-carboxyvinyltransferase